MVDELPNICVQEVIALPIRLESDWFCKWEQSGKLVPKFDVSVIQEGYEYEYDLTSSRKKLHNMHARKLNEMELEKF